MRRGGLLVVFVEALEYPYLLRSFIDAVIVDDIVAVLANGSYLS